MSLLSALRAQQASIPGATGTPAPGAVVQPTDTIGPKMAQYQADFAKWKAEQDKQNALMGALFGLGGSALSGWAMGGFPAFWK